MSDKIVKFPGKMKGVEEGVHQSIEEFYAAMEETDWETVIVVGFAKDGSTVVDGFNMTMFKMAWLAEFLKNEAMGLNDIVYE
jgi:hypothetical protein